MLNIGEETASKAKCYFSHTLLPQYIDEAQPPTKRKPFSTFYGQEFNHGIDLIVPASAIGKTQQAIKDSAGDLNYAKVHMKLLDILTGDFFTTYIKTGNIILLSEGRPGVDTTISLANGMLRLELDRPFYERCGLQGTPIPGLGRKHLKSRYLIELNLRAPAMVKGKKGFDRVLWAAENVLVDSLTWLFYDLRSPQDQIAGPIKTFQPFSRTSEVQTTTFDMVEVPVFPNTIEDREEDKVDAENLLEWLSLVCLGSPRVSKNDKIDSFLSRYEVPRLGVSGKEATPTIDQLVRLRWRGFMPSVWVAKVVSAAIKGSGESWFAMQVAGFESKGVMVLKNDGKAFTWECEG